MSAREQYEHLLRKAMLSHARAIIDYPDKYEQYLVAVEEMFTKDTADVDWPTTHPDEDAFVGTVIMGFEDLAQALDVLRYGVTQLELTINSKKATVPLAYHVTAFLNNLYTFSQRLVSHLRRVARLYKHSDVSLEIRDLASEIDELCRDVLGPETDARGVHVHDTAFVPPELHNISILEVAQRADPTFGPALLDRRLKFIDKWKPILMESCEKAETVLEVTCERLLEATFTPDGNPRFPTLSPARNDVE